MILAKRRRRIKMQSAYLQFKHPNILRTSDERIQGSYFSMFPPGYDQTNFFISGVLGMIDPRKKIGGERSSEVRKM